MCFQLFFKEMTYKQLHCLAICVSFKNFLTSLFVSLKLERTVEISKLFSSTKTDERDILAEVASKLEPFHIFIGEEQICGFVANINGDFLVPSNIITLFPIFPVSLQITETTDSSKEVCSLLIRTAYRINHNGEKTTRTVKLLNELLKKLTLKVQIFSIICLSSKQIRSFIQVSVFH